MDVNAIHFGAESKLVSGPMHSAAFDAASG